MPMGTSADGASAPGGFDHLGTEAFVVQFGFLGAGSAVPATAQAGAALAASRLVAAAKLAGVAIDA
jgi:hypothetical protein